MTGYTVRRYDQLETSPETIEQELRPAVCERRQTDRQTDLYMENYSIDLQCLFILVLCSDIAVIRSTCGKTCGNMVHSLVL